MERLRRQGRGWLAALCVALVSAFALAGGASAQTVGGIGDVGVDQEPPCLNPYISNSTFTCGSFSINSRIASVALPGAFRVLPDLTYEPRLVQSVEVRRNSLTYQLKPQAEWSDGVPVSADDLIFTFQTIMNPANEITSRAGYDLITQAVKVNATTVRFVFSRHYAAWKQLFPHVLPKHVLADDDFDTLWDSSGVVISDPDTGVPIGSGPFLVTSWVVGSRIELDRNPNWWGPHPPYLDQLVFRFYLDTNARFAALTSGTVDLLHESSVPAQAVALYDEPGFVADWHPGVALEHLDFSTSSTTEPLLQQRWFREAIAYSIDRAATLSTVFATSAPGLGPLQSLMYLTQQPEYKQPFARYQYSPATVASIMTSHGCGPGGDGIWLCPDTSDPGSEPDRASLRFATTTGNATRAQVQDLFQAQAQAAGIELLDDNSTAGVLFGTRLPARDFDLIMYAFGSNGDPLEKWNVYGCAGDLNFTDYCAPSTTQLLRSADSEPSPSYRASLVNRADSNLAGGLPSIPLYQQPSFIAYQDGLHGVVANAGSPRATWNAEDWYIDP